ncbi:MAG TPA: hypothetical protein VF834_04870 [Streptosporangiaceae bacterium]
MLTVRFRLRRVAVLLAVLAAAVAVVGWSVLPRTDDPRWQFRVSGGDYAARASAEIRLLERSFYNGTGLWHMCVPAASCFTKNRDWGSDSLTYVLYLRWRLTHDRSVLPLLRTLARTAPVWDAAATGSSDTVMWDSVADVREYQATGSREALRKAEQAFAWVDSVQAAEFATGACPAIDYQWPHGRHGYLKTLETDSNYIKAALLLYQVTGRHAYLAKAERKYDVVRRYFESPTISLYTVYVFDHGSACRPLPGHYFASVNGNMIWAGQALAQATGRRGYLRQATATARAVQAHLSDGAGVFADLQADNDVVEPLIEAMYNLASRQHQASAASWLMTNASAAGADASAAGLSGRFFDGPPPATIANAWQVNGAAALAQVAAALDPGGRPADPGYWTRARFVDDSRGLSGTPLRIAVSGRAIAIMGTVGAACCDAGHATVLVDGIQTYDRTGIWQNMTSPSVPQPDQVLFAWRWKTAGRHVITIRPAAYDREEGGSFFQMSGYLLVRLGGALSASSSLATIRIDVFANCRPIHP